MDAPKPASHRPPYWQLIGSAIFFNIIWAACYPLSKVLLTEVSPLAMGSWRVFGSALALLPFLKKRDFPEKITPKDLFLLTVMGVLGVACSFTFQFLGTAKTLSSNVALLVSIEPIVVILLAAPVLGEHLSPRIALGSLLALVGSVLLTVDPQSLSLTSSQYLGGNLWVMASVVCYAFYTLAGKLLLDRWGFTTITLIPFLIASVVLLPISYYLDPSGFIRGLHLTPTEVLGIAFITLIATALGYAVWNWLLHYLSAGTASSSLYVQPIAGVMISHWALGEPITLTMMAGAALIAVAIAAVFIPSKRQ